MNGWRGRIGLLIPATNTVMEMDFNKYLPTGMACFASRMYKSPISSVEANLEMVSYAKDAASLLAQADVDLVVFGCTAASFLGGRESNISITESLIAVTGVPCFTASTAIIEALKFLDVHNIALMTPYVTSIHEREIDFLQTSGFNIVSSYNMGIGKTADIGKVNPEQVYYQAKRHLDDSKADAIIVSCTTLRGMEIINALEQDFGKPVITSNQACLWLALKKLEVLDPVIGVGELLNSK